MAARCGGSFLPFLPPELSATGAGASTFSSACGFAGSAFVEGGGAAVFFFAAYGFCSQQLAHTSRKGP